MRSKSIRGFAVVLVTAVAVLTVVCIGQCERVNMTSAPAGLFWSTDKDEPGLMRKADDDDSSASAVANELDDLDGGFSSLEGMLQWAIGHSDPAKLKEGAQEAHRLSAGELQQRQMEIKELMEKLKMPSDAQLMKIAIDDLNNSSLSLENRQRALEELLILVEPFDNANGIADLHKNGGLVALINELSHPDSDIRRLSAWVLGKASQNNYVVQKQVLELGALARLIKMIQSAFVEEAIKALYAVSALIRNNLAGQELFYAEAGDMVLQELLGNSGNDIRLRRKAVFLVADLAEGQLENTERVELPFFSNRVFLKSVVDVTTSKDLDLQEKALFAIRNLLHLKTTKALTSTDFCGLDAALERMREQLQDLMLDESHRDYAMDVESLRREVELVFYGKLEKVETAVP